MTTYQLDVELEAWPDGGFVARVPALQGCWVVAETREQALADIYEGIEMHTAARRRRHEPLPPPATGAPRMRWSCRQSGQRSGAWRPGPL